MKTNPEQPDSKPKAEDGLSPSAKSVKPKGGNQKIDNLSQQPAVSLPPLTPSSQVFPRDRVSSNQPTKNNFETEKNRQAVKFATEELAKKSFFEPNNDGVATAKFNIFQAWLAWQIGAAALVMIFGSIGFTATSYLLKLPEAPKCDRVYWPIASASLRLYCAELAAQDKTADGLLEAIAMVENLPAKHPLRSEINRKIETWANKILDLGEAQFQSGSLEGAIAIAEKTPKNVAAYNLVEERIERWRSIWLQAEKLDREARQHLSSSHWYKAFNSARKLTNINNEYWSKKRYEEILVSIKTAQQESTKLDLVYTKLKSGELNDLILAIEKADRIDPNSYAYQEALQLISKAKDQLVAGMNRSISQGDWQQVLNIANRIPPSTDLENYVRDWNDLATAGTSAQIGTISSIESAIETAKKIAPTRPLYNKAQKLIGYWKLEIKDISTLARAREIARSGSISDLRQAISVARSIYRYNPRYQEAQREINSWVYRIQVAEDRPTLNRAYQIARDGSISGLKQAIATANLIAPNRALYQEAQGQIRKWRYTIETRVDSPILVEAESLARRGDLREAIATARQIRPGRALYNRSQARIRFWSAELSARENFRRADRLANSRTPQALIRAINLVSQIPASSSMSAESNRAVDRWSEQLLNIARDTAQTSLTQAINIAASIPPQASAYQAARSQMEIWQNQLNPRDSAVPQ